MTRTFRTLAILLTLSMLATIGLGFWSFFLDRASPVRKDIFLLHFYAGLLTALGILLVHCIIFTYFLGTGRWVKEVGLAYDLPDHELPRTTRELKRTVFPAALFAMLIAIAAAASGQGNLLLAWPWPIHASLAGLTLLINLWAFRVEQRTLEANAAVLKAVLDEVDRIRRAKGLECNAEALERDLASRQ
jgi:hypothetical protein